MLCYGFILIVLGGLLIILDIFINGFTDPSHPETAIGLTLVLVGAIYWLLEKLGFTFLSSNEVKL